MRISQRVGSLIIGLALRADHTIAAQSSGRIEGTVTDSIRRVPLAGATVIATADRATSDTAFHAATVDDAGHYVIQSLRPGRYLLSVEHPFIDSTTIGVLSRTITVPNGGTVQVALAIPSPATLRRVFCSLAARDTTLGMMIGVVRRVDGSPARGARLVFAWVDFDFDRTTAAARPKELKASAIADSMGVYRACGLPAGVMISAQAQLGAALQSGVLEERIGDAGILVRDFRVGEAIVAQNTDTSSALARVPTSASTPATHAGVVSGHVQQREGGPIQSAHVRLYGSQLETLSNATGAFRLAGIPEGTQGIEVVALGYEPRRLTVDVGTDTRALVITLDRSSVVLDSVKIVAKRYAPVTQSNREFDERARTGSNYYITEKDIELRHPFFLTDVLSSAPGIHITRRGFEVDIQSTRGATSFSSTCSPALYIDGVPAMADDLANLPPGQVHGVEVVAGVGATPRGQKPSACGAIYVWRK